MQQLAPWRAERAVAELAATREAALQFMPSEENAQPESSPQGGPSLGSEPSDPWQRADGSHGRQPTASPPLIAESLESDSAAAGTLEIDEEPARHVAERCPAAQPQLRLLEDVIFEAMAGKSEALTKLHTLWPEVTAQVGPSMVETVREDYLRYALSLWRQVANSSGSRDPVRACNAMEIICVLFEPR
jgi:hypothetical protein